MAFNLNNLLFWRKDRLNTPLPVKEAGGTAGQITQANIKNFVVKAVGQINDSGNGDFSPSEHDLDEIKSAINSDSYLKLAVVKYSQLIYKAGYNIVSQNDSAAEYITSRFRMMSFMTGIPMDVVFQQIAEDLVAYGNAFLIKSRIDMTNIGGLQAKGVLDTKPVGGYYRVDPSTIQIKRDKTGTIKGYQQQVGNNDKKYKPTDVIHIYIDKEGGAAFGTPRIESALEDVKLLRKIEGNVLRLIYRHTSPLMQMKIGIPEAGFMATDKEIKEAKSEIENLADDGIIITNERTDFKAVGAEGTALDISNYLKYFENRVFSALSLSSAMVGRGGVKQDADSMEEQVHDAVKFYQRTLSIFIENYIFTELLLEGGFNPVLNEDDTVQFQFNEISLETKVKMETHALNQFQGNAISFEEMRTELGKRTDNVDEGRLYANMIKTKNELELINAKTAGGSSIPGPDKKSNPNKQVDNTIAPENQHGKTTAKVKESFMDLTESTEDNIKDFIKNFSDVYKKYNTVRNIVCDSKNDVDLEFYAARTDFEKLINEHIFKHAKDGYKKALKDLGKSESQVVKFSAKELLEENKRVLKNMFKDIELKLKKASNREDKEAAFNSVEYRIRFLLVHIVAKAYWYSYVMTCKEYGIKKVYVNFGKSKDKEEHKSIINTNSFDLEDIPAFHAYCTCKLELNKAGGK